MLVRVANMNAQRSSISSSRAFSPVNVVHECSISLAAWQGESMEVCRSSCEHGSLISSSSITSKEAKRFLTTTKIHSS